MVEDRLVQNLLEDIKVEKVSVSVPLSLVIKQLALNGDTRALVGMSHDKVLVDVHPVLPHVVLEVGAGQHGAQHQLLLATQSVGGGTGLRHDFVLGRKIGPETLAVGLQEPGGALVVAIDERSVVVLVVQVHEVVGTDGSGIRVVQVLVEALVVDVPVGHVGEGVALNTPLPLRGGAANDLGLRQGLQKANREEKHK